MLTDPQAITINLATHSLPAVRREATKTTYQYADGSQRLIVSYDDKGGKVTRYLMRYEEDVIATDPITGVNAKKTLAVYMVIEQPSNGFTDARVDYVVAGFKTWLDSTTLLRVLSNEV